ncbi:hypothetical protein RJ641_024236 [Dillenia turbinata]|uniref:Uncharacterized protein n=1 Tax=Dillenia turbinata TaxID=194707 RepID=A0AAN8U8A5_9MAGN
MPDLGDCEVGRGLGGGNSGDGLHGLDGHGDVEEEASGNVVERCEDKGCRAVKVVDECESYFGAEVAEEVVVPWGMLGEERGGGGGDGVGMVFVFHGG